MAIADLCDYYGRGLLITRINVPLVYRGLGHGSALLKQICQSADEEDCALFLEIVPSGGLVYEQLRDWYERYGFKQWKGIYRRLPNGQ